MDVTFSTGSLTGFPLRTIFHIARSVGADGLELMLTPRLAAENPVRVQDLERHYDVPIRSVHTILRLTRATPEQAAADIVDSARFARNLPHCSSLVVHTPETYSLHTAAARTWLQAVETALELTRPFGPVIAIENSGRTRASDPTSFLDHPDRLRWLSEEWGVGITFDTSHAASRDWDLLAVTAKLAPHLSNVHLSDFATRTYRVGLANAFLRDHQLPGRGVLPLASLIQTLATFAYDGLLTLELSPFALRVPWRRSSERLLRDAVAFCRAAAAAKQPSTERSKHRGRS